MARAISGIIIRKGVSSRVTVSDLFGVMTLLCSFKEVIRLVVPAGLVVLAFVTSPVTAGDSAPPFTDFLSSTMGLSSKEIEHVAAGDVLVNVIDAADKHEVVLCGVVRADFPWQFALENLKALVDSRRESGKLQIERIGSPPTLADFESFSLPDDDVKDLAKAKKGSSNVKVTESLLEQLQSEVDWDGDYAADVNRIFREMLLRRTKAYLEGGLDNLAPYVDKDPPETVRDGMKRVLEPSSVLYEYVPEFVNYLARYPAAELEGTTDLIFCMLEDFGMKPTLSLRHASLYEPGGEYTTKLTLAEVSLYASHYYQAMFAVMAIVEAEIANEGRSTYVVWAQRFWFDGELGGIKRKTLQGRLRGSMEDNLKRQTERLSALYKEKK